MGRNKRSKQQRIARDEQVLKRFIQVYCRCQHLRRGVPEATEGCCGDCQQLLAYARQRNRYCPLDPKPACKNCKVHCYAPHMRQRIREVMKFSGIYFIKRGRLDWVWRYFC